MMKEKSGLLNLHLAKLDFINPKNNDITEFTPEKPLASPEAIVFDDEGNLWIAEHTGMAITKFDPILETFERISVPDKEALPYGMSFDRYGNIWISQHTIDKIAAYDPYNKNLIEVPNPTSTSFAQFSTSDDKDNVWFVEQQGNKGTRDSTADRPGDRPPRRLRGEQEPLPVRGAWAEGGAHR